MIDSRVGWPVPASCEGVAPIVVRWPNVAPGGANWGDKLNPWLVEVISGQPVRHMDDERVPPDAPVEFVIGSGLASARGNARVWGNGFIASSQLLQCPVDRVYAVRGPLSRARVVASGGSETLPLGDPALLLPIFYQPQVEPDVDVGIIQHFREAGVEPLPRLPASVSTRVIDITGDLKGTVDAVLSCRRIVSSSLHGLILAHAYGIPATWLKISDRPLGDDFKFRDYWASMGRPGHEPTPARGGAFVDPFATIATPGRVLVDLFALLQACPFIAQSRRDELVTQARALAGVGDPLAILNIHAGLASRPA